MKSPWRHALALAVLLLALIPVIGTSSIYNADEAAAAAQAKALHEGDGWLVDHPFPEVDPEGRAFPLAGATQTDEGFAPLGKHPLYPVLLSTVVTFGLPGLMLLSVVGAIVAAILGSRIARRLDPRLEIPTLWALGVFSPLFFDGYLVIAHAIGAAVAAAAALCVLRAWESGRTVWWVGATVAVITGTLLRTEGVFLGVGLAVAVGPLALAKRNAGAIAGAAVVGAGAVAAFLADIRWERAVLSDTSTSVFFPDTAEETNFLADKVYAFSVTWLLPDYEFPGRGSLLLALGILIGMAAAVIIRRKPHDSSGIRLFAFVAAALVAQRVLFPAAPIPGLLVALPVLLPALVLARRSLLERAETRLLLVAFALFSAGVLVTQYRTGGSGEWGGRYFAIGLPLLVPVVVLVLHEAGARLVPEGRRAAGGALVAALAAVALFAVIVHRDGRSAVPGMSRATERIAAATNPGDGGEPVVITTNGALARFGWNELDGERWLTVDDGELGAYLDRLAKRGITELTLTTSDPRRDLLPLPSDAYAIKTLEEPSNGWGIAVLVVE